MKKSVKITSCNPDFQKNTLILALKIQNAGGKLQLLLEMRMR